MKVCPKLSFRCLPLSSSVFLKVYKGVDLQLVYSVSPFPAFLTYFFKKEKKIQNRFFNLSEKRLGIELDAKDLPYLFIMNNDKIINLAFVPQKAIPLSTERYF